MRESIPACTERYHQISGSASLTVETSYQEALSRERVGVITLIDVSHASGQRIRERRAVLEGRGGRALSRETLAARVGVTTSTLQAWEGQGIPGADRIVALARELDCSLDWLLAGDEAAGGDSGVPAVNAVPRPVRSRRAG